MLFVFTCFRTIIRSYICFVELFVDCDLVINISDIFFYGSCLKRASETGCIICTRVLARIRILFERLNLYRTGALSVKVKVSCRCAILHSFSAIVQSNVL